MYSKNKYENIITLKVCGEMQKSLQSKINTKEIYLMAKENNPNSNKFKVSPWLIYTAILLIFLFISFITGGSSLQEPAQLSSSKFNTFLEKGQIEKVIVYNKTEAEVYLNAEALKDATHKK